MSKQNCLKEDDPAIFADAEASEKERLLAWITKQYEPATEICPKTSYGLKHDFKRDTGIYVLNGVMKGALLSLGFVPVNTAKQNWNFRMKVKIPDGFYKWATTYFLTEDSPLGDFVKDMEHDFQFPRAANTRKEIQFYLEARFACKEAKASFCILWEIYRKEMSA